MNARRLVALAAMTLAVASCGGGDDSGLAKDELVGTWTLSGQPLLFRFDADGTFAFDRSTLDAPFARGMYTIEGAMVALEATGPSCVDTWSWTATLVPGDDASTADELRVVFVDEGCGVVAHTEWSFTRLEP